MHGIDHENSEAIMANTFMKRNIGHMKMFEQNLNNKKILKKSLRVINQMQRINGGGDPFLNNTRKREIDFAYDPADLYNMQ